MFLIEALKLNRLSSNIFPHLQIGMHDCSDNIAAPSTTMGGSIGYTFGTLSFWLGGKCKSDFIDRRHTIYTTLYLKFNINLKRNTKFIVENI